MYRPAKGEDLDAGSEVKLTAFSEDLNMYLYPTEGILAGRNTPVWTAMSDPKSPEGVKYNKVPGVSLTQNKTRHKHATRI